ncbi:SRPBCC family protein [Pullulanibacillus pueri]|uniref:Activator of Hsp90 ATPase homologue 1/2-like C-terminal domain-containing protein n=1 Tax=Pullulanibacillus pueri TaxID=1437324 RepID=A0A8J2ZW10_9BACL|nr:SRPBCC domain-containing protein [Pullulanibacillus pueri]GGH82505.1 hypothetical protein GCM10007096_21990 [Pullulanibacillus pueri]
MTSSNHTVKDIEQTVILNAPIQKVWDYVSTPEGIEKWFMPNDFQAIVGHEFHIQSPFGPSPCKVLDIKKPHLISFSWDIDGWIVSFHLKEQGDQTEFTLVHGGWPSEDSLITKAKQKSSVVRDTMNNGWHGIVQQRLKKVVESL